MAKKKNRDQDYLFLSSYIHARETHLLSKEAMERMITAPSDAEAYRVLEELGYEGLAGLDARGLEEKLTESRLAFYHEVSGYAPDAAVPDVFKMKYDYHNAKAILKGVAIGKPETNCLSGLGRMEPEKLMNAVIRDERDALPPGLSEAIGKAEEKLAQTGDPQASDMILDKACFGEMLKAAEESQCDFLVGYVKLLADITNLRTAVRVQRQGMPDSFLAGALLEEGTVKTEKIREAVRQENPLESVFSGSLLRQCAEKGNEAVHGGTLTEFERLCDNAVNSYCAQARRINFGPATLVGYLHFLENETTAVRIIVTGRAAGLSPEQIRERLREV